jgi:hypothetical protein
VLLRLGAEFDFLGFCSLLVLVLRGGGRPSTTTCLTTQITPGNRFFNGLILLAWDQGWIRRSRNPTNEIGARAALSDYGFA